MKYDTPQVQGKTVAQKPPQDAHLTSEESARKLAAKKKAAGRFASFNQFHDHGVADAKLSLVAQVVWYSLWRYENWGRSRVSISKLAETCNMTERSVYTGLKQLRNAHLLEVVERGSSRSKCSIYRIKPSPTTEPGSVVADCATTEPCSLTTEPNSTPTEEQKVSEPSVLLQHGPAAARLSAAGPVLAEQTNSDGGNGPTPPGSAAPPSMSTEQQTRAYVRSRIAKLQSTGLRKEAIVGRIIPEFRDDPTAKGWAWDELARSLATATATATPSSRGTSVEESSW